MNTIKTLIVGCVLFLGAGLSPNLIAQHPGQEHEQHGRRAIKHHASMKKLLLAKGATEQQLKQVHELMFQLRVAMIDAEAKIQKAELTVDYLTHKKDSKIQDVEVAIDTLFAARATAQKIQVRGLFKVRSIFGEKTWAAVAPFLLPMLRGHDDDDEADEADEDGEKDECDEGDDEDDDGEDDDDDDDDGEDDDDDDDDDHGKKKRDL